MLAAIDLLHFHDASLKLDNYSLAKRWQTSADRAAGPAAISTALITCAETHERSKNSCGTRFLFVNAKNSRHSNSL
jgi:hypothetical protein